MNILNWFADHCFSNRGKAVAMYKRGMQKAKLHDHQGAIADYTSTLRVSKTPSKLTAMVLFNRALAHVAAGDNRNGVNDLMELLKIDSAPANVKSMAKQKLARIDQKFRKSGQRSDESKS